MENCVEFKFEKPSLISRAKKAIVDGTIKTIRFVDQNKEVLIVIVPAVCTAIGMVAKFASKHGTMKKMEKLKNNYIYDRSSGHYWKLDSEPSNADWIEIDKRHKSGEDYYSILTDLDLL